MKLRSFSPGPFTLTFGLRGFQSWLGIVLAAVTLIVCAWGYSLAPGIAFAAGFCLIAFTRLDARRARWKWLLQGLWLAGVFLTLCVTAQVMLGRFTFFEIGLRKPLLNLLCCGVFCSIFLVLFGAWRPAVTVGAFLLLVLAVVNSYVFMFRDRELAVLDIFTVSTAIKVAQQYNYTPTAWMLYGTATGLLAIYCQFSLPDVRLPRPGRVRLAALACALAGGLTLYGCSRDDTALRWGSDGTACHGTYLNIFLGLRDSDIGAPEDYSPEKVEAISQAFTQAQDTPGPNILVIMNESYCDLDVYPGELTTNISVTPFWDSLKENTIRGCALASVYGGNTANSEFEFLTGSTMAFLPTGAVPYNQYVTEDTCSLAWTLRSYGYTTLGTHNYHATGWDRDKVYPRLGFESSTFLEAYPQEDLLRGFVSDREQYAYLLSQLEAQEEPVFLFAVTMQNHGGYQNEQDSYDHTVTLTDIADPEAEQYLSLLNASDKALEYLLSSLSQSQEETIVLFFGDHQPMLSADFYEALNGSALDTLPEQMRQYTVPFIIWANYDIEEKELGLTSLNFLAGHLLDAAGLERSAYHQYLGQLESKIPAMNLLGYWSREQEAFLPYEQAAGEEADALNAYRWVQYNHLFDKENLNKAFFSLPTQGENGNN